MKTSLLKPISLPRPSESSFTSGPRNGGMNIGVAPRPVRPDVIGGPTSPLTNHLAGRATHLLSRVLQKTTGQALPFHGSPLSQLTAATSKIGNALLSNPEMLAAKLQKMPNLAPKLLNMADNFDRVASIVPPSVGKVFAETANTLRTLAAMASPVGPRSPMIPPLD